MLQHGVYCLLSLVFAGLECVTAGLAHCPDRDELHNDSDAIGLCVDGAESGLSGLSLLQRHSLQIRSTSKESSAPDTGGLQIFRSGDGPLLTAAAAEQALFTTTEVMKDHSRSIPRIIMQTYKNQKGNHTEKWLALNPGWEYKFFDDSGATEFLASISDELVDAYNSIHPGAVKADLLRLAWLWKNGGVYADQDLSAVDLEPYRTKADLYMLQSDLSKDGCVDQIYNAFIVTAPQSSTLKLALDRSLANIQGRFKGDDDTCFGIAGPIVIAQVLRELVPSYCEVHRCRGERTPVFSDGSCEFKMGQLYHAITGEMVLLEKEGDAQLKRFFNDPDPGSKYTSMCKDGLIYRKYLGGTLGQNMFYLEAGNSGFAAHTINSNPYTLRKHRLFMMD